MSIHFILRSLSPGLLPLALAACINGGPAVAIPSASASVGVDLGGAPARVPAPQMAALPTPMPGMTHAAQPGQSGGTQMAQAGQAPAQGTGTVNSVDAAGRKINMQHDPIPAIGWPAMTMDFLVAPSVDLRAVQPGARVNFQMTQGQGGMYVIQSITPAGGRR